MNVNDTKSKKMEFFEMWYYKTILKVKWLMCVIELQMRKSMSGKESFMEDSRKEKSLDDREHI